MNFNKGVVHKTFDCLLFVQLTNKQFIVHKLKSYDYTNEKINTATKLILLF